MPVSHTKIDNIVPWTQTELDAAVADGLYPPGTLLADIALPSDWNAQHSVAVTIAEISATGSPTSSNFLRGDGAWAVPSGGDVVGPASATDNAVARFDLATGKLIQNSVVLIADTTGNMTGVGTLACGTETITSSDSSALAVGPNGASNPVFRVSGAGSPTAGFNVSATTTAAVMAGIGSGADIAVAIDAKGTGAVSLRSGSGGVNLTTQAGVRVAITNSQYLFSGLGASTAAATARFSYVATANTSLTASTEWANIDWNNSATQQHATGALTLQRDFRIRAATHGFVGASTLTDAATFAVDGAPISGTNATLTNTSTIYSAGSAVSAGGSSYGLNIKANTGATANYAFRFEGSAGELINLSTAGKFTLLNTVTAGGTTGNRTIDKPSGTVNIAAAGTTVTVTNALCTTSSLVFAEVRTNDTTAQIKNVVPGAGSFVVNMAAAVTAETSVGFLIIN